MTAATDTRQALLDAAADAVLAGDWRRTRMADVARAAGVSRQTLYNEFGSKDALAAALSMREAERFIAGTETAMQGRAAATPADAVTAAVSFTLTEAAGNPLLKAVLTDDASGLLPYLTTRAEPLLVAARRSITAHLAERWPQLDAAGVALAAEAVVRLTVSYLVLPSDHPDGSAEAVAARIGRLAEPLLVPPTPEVP